MKKFTSFLIVLALLVTCFSVVSFATENPVVSVSSASGEVGETVTVEVSVSAVEAAGYTMALVYDETALELTAINKGSVVFGFWFGNVKTGKVTDTGMMDMPAEGVLFTATFTILTGGKHTVDVAVDNIAKADTSKLDVTTVAGTISAAVPPCAPGEHDLVDVMQTYTCEEDGYAYHYECAVCGQLFAEEDYEGTTPVTMDDLFVKAPGHIEADFAYSVEDNGDGTYTMEYACSGCGMVMRTEVLRAGETADLAIFIMADMCPVTSAEVPAGGSVFYELGYTAGNYIVITGGDFTVVATTSAMRGPSTTATYESQNGVVKFIDPATMMSSTKIEIINKSGAAATFTVNVELPLGARDNPEAIVIGENTATTYEGVQGYYMQWVADCSGIFTITMTEPGDFWGFQIYNANSGYSTDFHQYDEDGVKTDSVEFKTGDVIQVTLMNSRQDPETGMWGHIAGDITFEASVEYTHNVAHVEAVAPSCEAEGNIEYWYCVDCGIAWQDEALTQITNVKNVILPPAHTVEHVEAVEPGCETEGNIEYWYCTLCGAAWQDEAQLQVTNLKNVILPATHKNIIHMEAVEPGCHYIGHVEHWYCADCDMLWIDEDMLQISNHKAVILPALGSENVEAVPAREPDCTNPGHVAYWHCPDCDQYWTDEALTQLTNRLNLFTEAAKGHTYDDDKDMICNVCEFDRTNSQTGDFGIIAAVASAVISLTGIVALPVAKKKFF